ncbi:MAG: TIGR04076 family protein [Clostridia bacterium]|nr:TIGR04076 family protein [Clostridia bacterium]NCC42003.1 TIGR04076 family protein [Clostridia bacterium]
MSERVTLVVTKSGCPNYKVGDQIVFDGPVINKEESGTLCMTAINALYPFVFGARKGYVWESPMQCPDCGESVTFEFLK